MSRHIAENENGEGFYLCSFYGGGEREVCYQITVTRQITTGDGRDYVQLTKDQMDLIFALYEKDQQKLSGGQS